MSGNSIRFLPDFRLSDAEYSIRELNALPPPAPLTPATLSRHHVSVRGTRMWHEASQASAAIINGHFLTPSLSSNVNILLGNGVQFSTSASDLELYSILIRKPNRCEIRTSTCYFLLNASSLHLSKSLRIVLDDANYNFRSSRSLHRAEKSGRA